MLGVVSGSARWMALLALIASTTGCASTQVYTGPKRPAEDVAIVTTALFESFYFVGGTALWFYSVDGNTEVAGGNKVEVLPGRHHIAFQIFSGVGPYSGSINGSIVLNAEAGGRYQLHADHDDAGWRAWIVDKATGETVSDATL